MPRKAEFDSKHPLFEEFCRLRQEGTFIHQLVTLSAERGYPLSYRQINRGLSKAQYVKHLPSRSSHWLQKRVAEMDSKIDALETMHGLAALSAEKLYDIQTELADRELPFARRNQLEKLEKDERKTLWGFCRDIVSIEMGLGLRETRSQTGPHNAVGIVPGSEQDMIRTLAETLVASFNQGRITVREVEFEGMKLPAGTPEAVAPHLMLKEFGVAREPGEVFDEEDAEEAADFEEQV